MSGDTLTREDIRIMVDCPACGAVAGSACLHRGKGSAKRMRLGGNHAERMHEAQKIWNAGVRPDPLFEDGLRHAAALLPPAQEEQR